MDSYRSSNQQDQEDSLGAIPVSLGSYHNPPPPPNPIRISAFSKLSSATSSLNILSPKDHHHHHHHHRGTVVARNNGGSSATTTTTDQFMMTAPSTTATDHQDLIPVSISPSAAAATPNSTAAAVKYRECLRNHAASVGGHVLDGCCEFMPSDADPLKCAACDCHRSFHVEGTTSRRDRISLPPPLLIPPPPPPHPTSALHIPHLAHYSHKQQQQQQQHFAAFPPSPSGVVPGSSPMVAFGGNNSGSGATTESSSEERLDATTPQQQQNMVGSKKRFRTRFTPEQKEKMLSFAESVGWKIQRQDDGAVENFCREIGVRRQVLRVWMHNNKHSIIRKQQQQPPPQLPQQIQPQQPADSALTPTSQPPAPPIFGHVRN